MCHTTTSLRGDQVGLDERIGDQDRLAIGERKNRELN